MFSSALTFKVSARIPVGTARHGTAWLIPVIHSDPRLMCAGAFNGYVYWSRGKEAAFDWGMPSQLRHILGVNFVGSILAHTLGEKRQIHWVGEGEWGGMSDQNVYEAFAVQQGTATKGWACAGRGQSWTIHLSVKLESILRSRNDMESAWNQHWFQAN